LQPDAARLIFEAGTAAVCNAMLFSIVDLTEGEVNDQRWLGALRA